MPNYDTSSLSSSTILISRVKYSNDWLLHAEFHVETGSYQSSTDEFKIYNCILLFLCYLVVFSPHTEKVLRWKLPALEQNLK